MNKFLVILVAIVLSGCDASSSGDSAKTGVSPAAGFWSGSITTSTGEMVIGGMVASNGKVAFQILDTDDTGLAVYGDAVITGSSLSITGRLYDGESVDTITFTGSIVAGTSIKGDYFTSNSNEKGSISLIPPLDSDTIKYNRQSTLSKLNGIWNDSGREKIWVFNIGSEGAFEATRVTDNCSMSGSFETIDPTKNEYTFEAQTSSCPEADDTYVGLAFTFTRDDDEITDSVIAIISFGDSSFRIFIVNRQ